MIWFIGFLAFIIYRVFNAGMKSKELFYSKVQQYDSSYTKKILVEKFDGEKALFYSLKTLGFGVTWSVSLPIVGVFLLGQKYAAK